MTGADAIAIIILLTILVAVGVYLLHWLYRHSSKDEAFVRTGLGGEKVVMGGGALVIPIIHDITLVNMNTVPLELKRAGESSLITRNKMRVDVVSEFSVRVIPTRENISLAAGKCKLSGITINGQPPQKDAIYKVLTADFLATGPFVTALVSDPAAHGLGTGVKMMNDRQLFRDEWADALKAWNKDLDPKQFFNASHLRQTISTACDKDE